MKTLPLATAAVAALLLAPAQIRAQTPATDPATRTVNIVEKGGLKISCDKSSYQDGDTMQMTVEVPKDGYLRVYGVNANGDTTVLFPNKFAQEDKVTTGALTLPGQDAKYDFKLSLDAGQSQVTESIHAVFSPEPFTDSGTGAIKFGQATFQTVGVTTAKERSTRGLKPTAKTTSADAELKYDLTK